MGAGGGLFRHERPKELLSPKQHRDIFLRPRASQFYNAAHNLEAANDRRSTAHFRQSRQRSVLIVIAVPAPLAKQDVIEAFPSPVEYDVRPCYDFSRLAYRSAIPANTFRTPQTGAKFRPVCDHPSTALGSVGLSKSVWIEFGVIRPDLPSKPPLLRSKFRRLGKFVLLKFTGNAIFTR